jgi:hypothetical protein
MRLFIFAACLALTGCARGELLGVAAPEEGGDFLCTINGDQSFMVEDIKSADVDGLVWRVETASVVYRYAQLSGEVCSTEKTK